MSVNFENKYHHRRVADAGSKPCEVCHKRTSSVLTTVKNSDFFYVCTSHLSDRKFCLPIENKQTESPREDQDKQLSPPSSHNADVTASEKPAEKQPKKGTTEDQPLKQDEEQQQEARVFALHNIFYQQRLGKKRQVELAKRTRQKLQDPGCFPSPPSARPQ